MAHRSGCRPIPTEPIEAERCRRSLLVGIDGVLEVGNDPERMAAWERISLHVMESLLLDEE